MSSETTTEERKRKRKIADGGVLNNKGESVISGKRRPPQWGVASQRKGPEEENRP